MTLPWRGTEFEGTFFPFGMDAAPCRQTAKTNASRRQCVSGAGSGLARCSPKARERSPARCSRRHCRTAEPQSASSPWPERKSDAPSGGTACGGDSAPRSARTGTPFRKDMISPLSRGRGFWRRRGRILSGAWRRRCAARRREALLAAPRTRARDEPAQAARLVGSGEINTGVSAYAQPIVAECVPIPPQLQSVHDPRGDEARACHRGNSRSVEDSPVQSVFTGGIRPAPRL